MNSFTDSLRIAFELIVQLDPELLRIVWLSLQVSASACLIGAGVGLWLGAWLAVARFPGHAALVWALTVQAALLGAWMALFARPALAGSLALWRQSLLAGFLGAFASHFWFLGFSLTAAANVRTLALIEVMFAHVVARRVFEQRATRREIAGMALVVVGVALLLLNG